MDRAVQARLREKAGKESAAREPATADQRVSGALLPPTLTRRTGFLLSALGRRCSAAAERALAPLGIKPHHYGVLVVLEAASVATQQAVGERLGIDKSTMTVVGDFLEDLHLVERRRNPVNRRAYELTVEAHGPTLRVVGSGRRRDVGGRC